MRKAEAMQDTAFSAAVEAMVEARSFGAGQHAGVLRTNLTPDVAADIVHFLGALHGRHPTLIDHAARKLIDDRARGWMAACARSFVDEREVLARLAVAVGPMVSTCRSDEASAIIPHMVRAFRMLGESDRSGCPEGTAIAFVIDWNHIRPFLDKIAHDRDMTLRPCTLPDIPACRDLTDALSDDPARRRAMMFGIEQYLDQTEGLWRMLAARRQTRL